MSSLIIASRYASALFDMANDAHVTHKVQEDLASLLALAAENADFAAFLKSPLVARGQAKDALDAILTKGKAQDVTRKFLQTLAQNRRLALLPHIAGRLDELVLEQNGTILADVESATPLDAALQKQVMDALSKTTGKKIRLRLHENKALLGGMVVRYSGKRLDLSVAGRLDRLSQSLRAGA